MKKTWWARIAFGSEYGYWVPTGCTDKDEAEFYLRRVHQTYGPVREWLEL